MLMKGTQGDVWMKERKQKKQEKQFSPNAGVRDCGELNEDFCRLVLRLTEAKLSPISWHSRPQQQV